MHPLSADVPCLFFLAQPVSLQLNQHIHQLSYQAIFTKCSPAALCCFPQKADEKVDQRRYKNVWYGMGMA